LHGLIDTHAVYKPNGSSMIQKISVAKVITVIHTIIIYMWVIASTVVFGLLAILVSFFSKKGDGVHHIAQIWGRSITLVSGIRVTSTGVDPKFSGNSYIYMSNHQSNFDIPVLYSALPVQFRWLAKAELFRIPIFGNSMRCAGYISIDRSNRKSAFQSLVQATDMIRNGTSVMIFPEGTRSTDGQLLPFKKGGFLLAVDAGVPIIPIKIYNTQKVMPKGRLLVRHHRVMIQIGSPIQTSGYTRKTKDDLIARVRDAMLSMPSMQDGGGGDG
jgi:1-acyl-sn-glycerol-3-phosphate acyltransferase